MREIRSVRFTPAMTKREISWRMALARIISNRRKLEEMQAQLKQMTALLTAKLEQLRQAHKERELRRVLAKLGLLK